MIYRRRENKVKTTTEEEKERGMRDRGGDYQKEREKEKDTRAYTHVKQAGMSADPWRCRGSVLSGGGGACEGRIQLATVSKAIERVAGKEEKTTAREGETDTAARATIRQKRDPLGKTSNKKGVRVRERVCVRGWDPGRKNTSWKKGGQQKQ